MTWTKFQILCGKYLIDVNIALENEKILKALKNRDDKKVRYILKNEY